MITAWGYVETQLRLECIGVDESGRLSRVPGSTCDDIEYVLIYKDVATRETMVLFNSELSAGQVLLLRQVSPNDIDTMVSKLHVSLDLPKRDDIRRERWYYFPKIPSASVKGVEPVHDSEDCFDLAAVREEGAIISRAWSVRRNEEAAECAVETIEGKRRSGLAKKVVTAWVAQQFLLARLPMYNHRLGNLESETLAKSLGAVCYAEITSIY